MNVFARFSALLLAASACFSQGVGPGTDPAKRNGFVSDPPPPIGAPHHFLPGNTFFATVQLGVFLGNTYYPAQGVPVSVTQYPQVQTGYHTHEIALVSQRPNATWYQYGNNLSAQNGNTANDGTVTFYGRFPPFAGWYTTQFTALPYEGLVFGTTGTNNHVFFWTLNPDGQTEDQLIHYTNDTSLNFDQGQAVDNYHEWNGVSGYSFYATASTVAAIQSASRIYRTATSTMATPDLLDIRRCSLPEGGIADNDIPPFAPNQTIVPGPWAARNKEGHEQGRECDIVNPDFIDQSHMTIAEGALATAGCVMGTFTPDGSLMTNAVVRKTFWDQANIWHVACSNVGSSR